MKISVKVKANSKESRIEKIEDNLFLVHVKSPPFENKANCELIEIVSEYFNVPKSKVSIISGMNSKNKILEIKK
jgi:uncharacterized protein (TIGR00251 family)